MTPLEGTIIQQVKQRLEALRAVVSAGPSNIDDLEFCSIHARLSELLVLGHLADDGMTCEARSALLSVERETTYMLINRPSWAELELPNTPE